MSKKISKKDEIKWSFNGRKLDVDNSTKYQMETDNKSCKLIIKNIALDDEGSYAVEVNSSKSSANLTVEGEFQYIIVLKLFLCIISIRLKL